MNLLLSSTASKILQVLLENPFKKFKEIELVNTAKIGKGAGAERIKALFEEGIVLEQRVGKAKVISLNLRSPAFFFIKNIFDQQKVKRLSALRLAAILFFSQKVQPPASLLILFGSTAAGTATTQSDIDLLIAGKNIPVIETARSKTEELFGARLNLHVYALEEIYSKIKEDTFLQNVLLQGVIVKGYDTARDLFLVVAEKEKKNFQRLDYFGERIAAAKRNYAHHDYAATEEIINYLQEQLIFYILTEKKISYQSKKDAAEAIQKLPEGKVFSKVAALNEKIDKLGLFLQEIVIRTIIEEEYGFKTRNT